MRGLQADRSGRVSIRRCRAGAGGGPRAQLDLLSRDRRLRRRARQGLVRSRARHRLGPRSHEALGQNDRLGDPMHDQTFFSEVTISKMRRNGSQRGSSPRDARTDVCTDRVPGHQSARRETLEARARRAPWARRSLSRLSSRASRSSNATRLASQTPYCPGARWSRSSSAALPTDPELSLWFAIQAEDTSPSVQADKLLRQAFLESRIAPHTRFRARPDIRSTGCSR